MLKEVTTILIYNKLVRDEIPKIIRKSGKKCEYSIITGEKLILALQDKLVEEFNEFIDSNGDLEELADILEVVEGLAVHLGSSFEEILAKKEQKQKQRGGFKQGIFLESVED